MYEPWFPEKTLKLPTFPLPRLKSPRFALPMFNWPRLARPALKIVPVGPRNTPDRLVPMLFRPETLAGVERFTVLVLKKPDTELPRFAQPDCSEPRFWKPEFPIALLKPLFQTPELPPPTFWKPDVPPVPELKKPDEGLVVEFPMPGAGSILRKVIVRLSRAPTMLMRTVTVGPPMVRVIVGTVSVDALRLTGPKKNKPLR
ncbi:Uncharacterised protein [Mycobacterium tuberculosis]|nr:Uncharacterised protein [Mycobacterium tuberculosis]CKM38179.1 Uncharacterised protein [Mycobacterium tuberculosis]CKN20105.1 Uncharacterised protein [Mycobacterium tuberculosis]CKN29191.1 Uncharacterised protein [Mycobacterium tuberculosis]